MAENVNQENQSRLIKYNMNVYHMNSYTPPLQFHILKCLKFMITSLAASGEILKQLVLFHRDSLYMRCRLPPASLSFVCCLVSGLLYQKGVLAGPFSVGEDKEMLVKEEDSLILELTAMLDTDSMLGYWLSS